MPSRRTGIVASRMHPPAATTLTIPIPGPHAELAQLLFRGQYFEVVDVTSQSRQSGTVRQTLSEPASTGRNTTGRSRAPVWKLSYCQCDSSRPERRGSTLEAGASVCRNMLQLRNITVWVRRALDLLPQSPYFSIPRGPGWSALVALFIRLRRVEENPLLPWTSYAATVSKHEHVPARRRLLGVFSRHQSSIQSKGRLVSQRL